MEACSERAGLPLTWGVPQRSPAAQQVVRLRRFGLFEYETRFGIKSYDVAKGFDMFGTWIGALILSLMYLRVKLRATS